MKRRICLSFILLTAFWVFSATIGDFYNIAKTPAVGSLAADQLADSNSAYAQSMYEINLLNHFSPNALALLALLAGLALVWKSELKKLFTPTACLLLCVAAFPESGSAYYSKTDYTEVVEILPNQTAFLIPETGANKEKQASFMSEDYLNVNKVAMKRVTIPHVKLEGSSVWADFYVPGARLLIVDRTPSTREWVSTPARGTDVKDQGFHFESAESINVSTGIVISAFVKEEDAAKFVYWFGSHKQEIADTDNEARFASVIHARSLAEVVDDNVRHKVQAVLAREFGKLPLVEAAAHKAEVIAQVEKEVKETFLPMGITVSFVGYAEGLTYDPKIQAAIDGVFLATKETEAKTQRMAAIPFEQAMVNINFINAQADAMKTASTKWDGKLDLPNWVVVPQGITDNLASWMGKGKLPDAKPADVKLH